MEEQPSSEFDITKVDINKVVSDNPQEKLMKNIKSDDTKDSINQQSFSEVRQLTSNGEKNGETNQVMLCSILFIILCLFSVFITRLIIFFWSKSRCAVLEKELDKLNLEKEFQKHTENDLENRIKLLTSQLDKLYFEQIGDRDQFHKTLQAKENRIQELQENLIQSEKKLYEKDKLIIQLNLESASQHEKLEIQTTQLQELNKKFITEFENLAHKIFEQKTEKFSEMSKSNLDTILEPLTKDIRQFKDDINKYYLDESKERFLLQNEVSKMCSLNQLLAEESKNLTNALRGNSKTQGNWGEFILENILKKSGLRENHDYHLQYQLLDEHENQPLKNADGKKMRPDAIVILPSNKAIIIDAKVSLTAFLNWMESSTPEEQEQAQKEHIQSIKNHIKELSKKEYDSYGKSVDFVMMFIPNEPAYINAIQYYEENLWDYAYKKNILLISPTNLMCAIRIVSSLWKIENQNSNIKKIVSFATQMCDKFSQLITEINTIKRSLDHAQSAYNKVVKKLTGPKNICQNIKNIVELGIKTKTNIEEIEIFDHELLDNMEE